MRTYGGFCGILLFMLLFSTAWGGSGIKPSGAKFKLLFEGNPAQSASPSVNAPRVSPGNAVQPVPGQRSFEEMKRSIPVKIRHKSYPGLWIGIGFLMLLFLGFLSGRGRGNKEKDEEW